MSEAKQIFKNSSKTFYNSSLFFTADELAQVEALYAFVRVVDEFVDGDPKDVAGLKKFIKIYGQIMSSERAVDAFSGYQYLDIITNFIKLSEELGFEEEWVEAFFSSMSSDGQSRVEFRTYAGVDEYMYGAAQVIGLFMCKILGIEEEGYGGARDLGRAFQWINFIRDINEDLGLGRVYMPQAELKTCQLESLEYDYVSQPDNIENFKRFVSYQLARYNALVASASQGFEYMTRRQRVAVQTAVDNYDWTARQIAADPLTIYSKKVKPSKMYVLWRGVVNWLGL